MLNIQGALDSVELWRLIAETVDLKKKGNVYEGLCPFHAENSPSFKVFSDNFHCYGCGEHGDALDWLQKRHGVTLREAVEIATGGRVADSLQPVLLKREQAPAPVLDPEPAWRGWMEATAVEMLREHAEQLDVSWIALQMLRAAYCKEKNVWAWPQYDATGKMVGIRFRNDKAEKWSMRNGRAGLFVPDTDYRGDLYIAEGPTDTATLLTLGFTAIGRPSCLGQEDMISDFVTRNKFRRVVIVSDNDKPKTKPDGSLFYPGLSGAQRLQEFIPVPSCIYIVDGAKDIREWYSYGGSAALLESQLKNTVWTKGKTNK